MAKEGEFMMQYELAIVINGKLPEIIKEETMNKVLELIERYGGKILKVDDWGKRRLAYEIQKVREGFYLFITFQSDAEVPSQIEKSIRIMEMVLRFLIVKVEE